MDPITIAILVGALAGAAKTGVNKKERKDPMAWLKNVGLGAAAGATGGAGAASGGAAAMAGLKGGLLGGGGMPGGGGMSLPGMDGGTSSIPIPGSTGGRPTLLGQISQDGPPQQPGGGGMNMDALGGLLKSMTGGSGKQQPAASLPMMGIPGIEAPIPSNIQFGALPPLPQYQAPALESLMYGRRRYGNG